MCTTGKFLKVGFLFLGLIAVLSLNSCDESGDPAPTPNGNNRSYPVVSLNNDNISGELILAEYSDGSVNIILELNNTVSGNTHPAFIYFDNALEGNQTVLTLNPVDGATGGSQTRTTQFDDGTSFTFGQLLEYDGHVKIHASPTDLNTVLAAGDFGANAFTGDETSYDLEEADIAGITGIAVFRERFNGEALLEISLDGADDGNSYPAHIHVNTAVEGGQIAISLNPVVQSSSATNISQLDPAAGGQQITYNDLIDYDGHLNVHSSAADLSTLAAQADIGINTLTGQSISYDLQERNISGVSGTIVFAERRSGETLSTISLTGTTAGAMHPAHIHVGTAAQEDAGLKAVILNPVNGSTGISLTNIAQLDQSVGGTPVTFSDLVNFDGYVNIHTSMADLTLLAQTDIGQNALTGTSISYPLDNIPGVTGTAEFFERVNGNVLVVLSISGIPVVGDHPAHIHGGSVAGAPGPVEITLADVNSYGFSRTSVEETDGGTALTYADLIIYDGYVNVHESQASLGVIIAQGDIGSNGG